MEEERKKRKPAAAILLVVAVLAALGLLVFGLVRYLGGDDAPPQVQVPSVVDAPQDAATATLTGAGFRVESMVAASDTVDEGNVISQTPEGGTRADQGSTVRITVSGGPDNVEVPDLAGRSLDEARGILSDLGLTLGTVDEVNDANTAENVVISSDPGSQVAVKPGTRINVTVGTGQVEVPNVVGMSQNEAQSALADANLKVETSYEQTDQAAEGDVISQDPKGKQAVDTGSTVKIVVAQKAAPTPPRPRRPPPRRRSRPPRARRRAPPRADRRRVGPPDRPTRPGPARQLVGGEPAGSRPQHQRDHRAPHDEPTPARRGHTAREITPRRRGDPGGPLGTSPRILPPRKDYLAPARFPFHPQGIPSDATMRLSRQGLPSTVQGSGCAGKVNLPRRMEAGNTYLCPRLSGPAPGALRSMLATRAREPNAPAPPCSGRRHHPRHTGRVVHERRQPLRPRHRVRHPGDAQPVGQHEVPALREHRLGVELHPCSGSVACRTAMTIPDSVCPFGTSDSGIVAGSMVSEW